MSELCNRGSTPTNTFRSNLDLRGATLFITYKQGNRTVIEHTGTDVTVTETTISTKLSQQETLRFKDTDGVDIQIRYIFEDGTSDSSNIIHTTVGRILKDGEIAYV